MADQTATQVLYAAAFADAVKQLTTELNFTNGLSATLREKAKQLSDLADLVDTTLQASEKKEEKPAEEKKEDDKPAFLKKDDEKK